MATVVLSPATFSVTTGPARSIQRTKPSVTYIGGASSFRGLEAHNCVASLGRPVRNQQGSARFVGSLRLPFRGKGRRRGGVLAAKCSAADEIFRIATIMNGLVLVGVAVGFVLLRIEAFVEEAE